MIVQQPVVILVLSQEGVRARPSTPPSWLIPIFFLKFIYLFIYLWLHWVFIAACRLFSSCGEWGLLFVAVRGLLIAVASLVVDHGL